MSSPPIGEMRQGKGSNSLFRLSPCNDGSATKLHLKRSRCTSSVVLPSPTWSRLAHGSYMFIFKWSRRCDVCATWILLSRYHIKWNDIITISCRSLNGLARIVGLFLITVKCVTPPEAAHRVHPVTYSSTYNDRSTIELLPANIVLL